MKAKDKIKITKVNIPQVTKAENFPAKQKWKNFVQVKL